MIIKLLIIVIVVVAGIALIYPDELIQFSKGSTIQENTEQSFSNLKDISFDEIDWNQFSLSAAKNINKKMTKQKMWIMWDNYKK